MVLFAGCSEQIDTREPPPDVVTPEIQQYGQVPITFKDGLGNNISIPRPATRIAAKNGLAAEVLVGIGEGRTLVGVTDALYSEQYLIDHMPDVQNIGPYGNPSTEFVISLKPDIILTYNSKDNQMDLLEKAGIPVVHMDCGIRDLPRDARTLGIITGNRDGAEKYAAFFENYLATINSRLANLNESERPRVYVESFGTDFTTYGQGGSGDEVLRLLRARNIAGNITFSTSLVAPEWVADEDPEVIIKYVSRSKELKETYNKLIRRQSLVNVSAIRNNRIHVIKNDLIAGPRGVAGILYLAKVLYPDRFSDIDPDSVLEEYAETFIPGSDNVQTYYPPLAETGRRAQWSA